MANKNPIQHPAGAAGGKGGKFAPHANPRNSGPVPTDADADHIENVLHEVGVCPPADLAAYADDPEPKVRMAVLLRSDCSPALVNYLGGDANADVRHAVVRRQDVTIGDHFKDDDDPLVRLAYAQRWDTSEEDREAILADRQVAYIAGILRAA